MTEITRASVLAQIRDMTELASARLETPAASSTAPSFGDTLKNSLNAVNELQQTSAAMATKFQAGDSDTTLVNVMLASQKSSLAFHATTEVRNKLVNAYQEIMNMPV
ncbi:MAG: flagellar hook-basal body complex protein FliE [Pseudomonadota bacterium]